MVMACLKSHHSAVTFRMFSIIFSQIEPNEE